MFPEKKCSKCLKQLPTSMFSKDKQKKDGLRSSCKECAKKYNKQKAKKEKQNRHKLKNIEFKEKKIDGEIWKNINGFNNYKISNMGRVYRNPCRGGGGFLKGYLDNGYKMVGLTVNKKSYKKQIHRLIAEHFLNNPDNLPCVDHINRNRQDNRICNLRWVSYYTNAINKNVKGCVYKEIMKKGKYTYTYWTASIKPLEKKKIKKRFKTKEEADKYLKILYDTYKR